MVCGKNGTSASSVAGFSGTRSWRGVQAASASAPAAVKPRIELALELLEDVGDTREFEYQEHEEDDADDREEAVSARGQLVELPGDLGELLVREARDSRARGHGVHAQLH